MKYSDLVKKYSSYSKDEEEEETVQTETSSALSIDSLKEKYNSNVGNSETSNNYTYFGTSTEEETGSSTNFNKLQEVYDYASSTDYEKIIEDYENEQSYFDSLPTSTDYEKEALGGNYLTESQIDIASKIAGSTVDTDYTKYETPTKSTSILDYGEAINSQAEAWKNSEDKTNYEQSQNNLYALEYAKNYNDVQNTDLSVIDKIFSNYLAGLDSSLPGGNFVDEDNGSIELPGISELKSAKLTEDASVIYNLYAGVTQAIGGMSAVVAASLVPGIGSVLAYGVLAATSFNNAYNTALLEGYDSDSAGYYGIAIASLEMITGKLLSGFSSVLGKSTLSTTISNTVSKVFSSLAESHPIILSVFSDAISEFGEEFVQEWLEPKISAFILDNESLIDSWSASSLTDIENFYAGLIGALTSGTINTVGGVSISNSLNNTSTNAQNVGVDNINSISATTENTATQGSNASTDSTTTGQNVTGNTLSTENNVSTTPILSTSNNTSNVSNSSTTPTETNVVYADTAKESTTNVENQNTVSSNSILDTIDNIKLQSETKTSIGETNSEPDIQIEEQIITTSDGNTYAVPDAELLTTSFGVDNLSAIIDSLSTEDSTIGTSIENIQNNLQTTEISPEVVVNAVEQLKTNSTFMEALKSYNPTLFDQIYGSAVNYNINPYSESKEKASQNIANKSKSKTNLPESTSIKTNFKNMTTEELLNLDRSALTEAEIAEINQILIDRNVSGEKINGSNFANTTSTNENTAEINNLNEEIKSLKEEMKSMKEDMENRLNEIPIESYAEQENRNADIQDLNDLKDFIKGAFGKNNVNQIINEIEENGVASAINKYAKTTVFENEELKNLKTDIRKTKLDVSELRSSYSDYIKNAFGTMKLANSGQAIDSYYEELRSEYPNLLDEVNSVEDAFMRLYEISKMDTTIEENVMDNEEAFQSMFDTIDAAYNNYALLNDQYIKYDVEPILTNTKGNEVKKIEKIEPINLDPTYTYAEETSIELAEENARITAEEDVAKIYSSMPKKQRESKLKQLKEKFNKFRQTLIENGNAIRNLAKENNSPELYYKYDRTLASFSIGNNVVFQYQSDSKGKKIGKSVAEIKKPIEESGKMDLFSQYAVEKLNIDRMSLKDKSLQKIIEFEQKNADLVFKVDENGNVVPKTIEEIKQINTKKSKQYIKLIENYEKTNNKTATGRTASESSAIVAKLEAENPEFSKTFNELSKFYENELDLSIEAGLIPKEYKKVFREMYPNYIRIQRSFDGSSGNTSLPKAVKVNAPNIKATGGTQDILPIFDTAAQYAIQNRNAIIKNDFGQELLKISDIEPDTTTTVGTEILTDEEIIRKIDDKYYFTVFVDGKATTMEINEDIYSAIKTGYELYDAEKNFVSEIVRKTTSAFKKGLIDYNFLYTVPAHFKDIGDAAINSKYPVSFAKNYSASVAAIATNSEGFQEYKALGGMATSVYETKTGFKAPSKNIISKGLNKMQQLNSNIEQIARYAEYLSSIENGASIEEALYNAAEVTTNFKKGGKITKALDRNGVSFLNASVQGFDKAIRNFSEQKGARAYVSLLSKAAVFGVLPSVLNYLAYDDDEDYIGLSDYIKNTYYLFKMDDGTWFQIPKGRLASIFGVAATNVLQLPSDEDAFDGFMSFVVDQIGVSNPFTNNIFSAAFNVYNNTTWYGTDLVSTSMQSLPPSEQYDSSIDSFSIWLGNILDVSPIKINYLLDQYTGIFGDMILPAFTKQAEENILINKFTSDNTNNSKYAGDFYDALDEYTEKYKSTSNPATDEEILAYKYLTTVSSTLSKLYSQKDEIQSSDLSDSEKLEQVKAVQLEINQIAQTAVQNATTGYIDGNYAAVGEYEYYKDDEGTWNKLTTSQQSTLSDALDSGFSENDFYTLKNQISSVDSELSSAETKVEIANIISNYNGTDEEKAFIYSQYYSSEEKLENIVSLGISVDEFMKLDSATIEGEKNGNGDTISGTLKTAYITYINDLNLTVAKKAILIKMLYSTYDDYNTQIVNYINNLSTTLEEKTSLLTYLGFEVSDGGVVSW